MPDAHPLTTRDLLERLDNLGLLVILDRLDAFLTAKEKLHRDIRTRGVDAVAIEPGERTALALSDREQLKALADAVGTLERRFDTVFGASDQVQG